MTVLSKHYVIVTEIMLKERLGVKLLLLLTRGVSLGGSGRLLQETFQTHPTWRRPRGPAHAGGSLPPVWKWNTAGFPQMSRERYLRRRNSINVFIFPAVCHKKDIQRNTELRSTIQHEAVPQWSLTSFSVTYKLISC